MRFRNVVIVFIISLMLAPVAWTQAAPKLKEVPIKHTLPSDGAAMYREYCAVCHGLEGKGDGPAAAALKTVPGNLTMLAQRNNGKFPGERVQSMIEGRIGVSAHGTREMPIWGSIFRSHATSGSGLADSTLRAYNLMKYVESLQVK